MPAILNEPFKRFMNWNGWSMLAALSAIMIVAASPALAHTDHKKKTPESAQVVQPGSPQVGPVVMNHGSTQSMSGMMEEMAKDRSKMSTGSRVLDWLGRLHPMVVHFPMAFFPAALFTAIIGRRRPAFGKPVQFLVVAGGLLAPIAALLGWFNGGFDVATDDAMLEPHRWLGTAIGVGALGLGIWAWRQPEEDRGPGMTIGLAIITAAIVVQGWFGGALVHGMDHMNW